MLDHLQLSSLNISKNNLGDEGIIQFISKLKDTFTCQYIEKLDISNCKLSDKSFMLILESLNCFEELKYIKCVENYISEKYEKIYAELLKKNETLIGLQLQGNRLSLSGLKGIKRIIDRNLKDFEEK